eukprot:5342854-Prymnesium_polylepis.1
MSDTPVQRYSDTMRYIVSDVSRYSDTMRYIVSDVSPPLWTRRARSSTQTTLSTPLKTRNANPRANWSQASTTRPAHGRSPRVTKGT